MPASHTCVHRLVCSPKTIDLCPCTFLGVSVEIAVLLIGRSGHRTYMPVTGELLGPQRPVQWDCSMETREPQA